MGWVVWLHALGVSPLDCSITESSAVSLLGGKSVFLGGVSIRKQMPWFSCCVWGELSRQASGRGRIKAVMCFILAPHFFVLTQVRENSPV